MSNSITVQPIYSGHQWDQTFFWSFLIFFDLFTGGFIIITKRWRSLYNLIIYALPFLLLISTNLLSLVWSHVLTPLSSLMLIHAPLSTRYFIILLWPLFSVATCRGVICWREKKSTCKLWKTLTNFRAGEYEAAPQTEAKLAVWKLAFSSQN